MAPPDSSYNAPLLSLDEPNILRLTEDRQGGQKNRNAQWKCYFCCHLVAFPVPEEVNRAVFPAQDNGPASVVYILFAPGLHRSLGFIGFDQVHAAGDVARVLCLETISERP